MTERNISNEIKSFSIQAPSELPLIRLDSFKNNFYDEEAEMKEIQKDQQAINEGFQEFQEFLFENQFSKKNYFKKCYSQYSEEKNFLDSSTYYCQNCFRQTCICLEFCQNCQQQICICSEFCQICLKQNCFCIQPCQICLKQNCICIQPCQICQKQICKCSEICQSYQMQICNCKKQKKQFLDKSFCRYILLYVFRTIENQNYAEIIRDICCKFQVNYDYFKDYYKNQRILTIGYQSLKKELIYDNDNISDQNRKKAFKNVLLWYLDKLATKHILLSKKKDFQGYLKFKNYVMSYYIHDPKNWTGNKPQWK